MMTIINKNTDNYLKFSLIVIILYLIKTIKKTIVLSNKNLDLKHLLREFKEFICTTMNFNYY